MYSLVCRGSTHSGIWWRLNSELSAKADTNAPFTGSVSLEMHSMNSCLAGRLRRGRASSLKVRLQSKQNKLYLELHSLVLQPDNSSRGSANNQTFSRGTLDPGA